MSSIIRGLEGSQKKSAPAYGTEQQEYFYYQEASEVMCPEGELMPDYRSENRVRNIHPGVVNNAC